MAQRGITVLNLHIVFILSSFDRNLSEPLDQRVHSLWGNDAFLPCFRFPPLFSKNFSNSVKNVPNFTFSRKNSLLFCSLTPFPPLFRKKFISFYFCKFRPWFRKSCVFLHAFCVFRVPPTLTIMHHTMHVGLLDAPGWIKKKDQSLA